MKTHIALFGLLVVSLAGYAGSGNAELLTAKGVAALDAYQGRGLSRAQIIALARRGALIDGQRNLLEAYAGTFLSSQTEIKNFVTEHDRIISKSSGLIRGVYLESEQQSPDNTAWVVTVRADKSALKAELDRWNR